MPIGDSRQPATPPITKRNGTVEAVPQTTPHVGSIHWLAPTSMVTFLVLGSLFALGHHLFYQSLNANPVSPSGHALLGTHVSSQQWNTSIGTIFAFLVKACLGASVSIAFAQLFWKTLTFSSVSRPLKLSMVDAAFSGATGVMFLFTARLWIRCRLMFILAVTAWLIAVPSVITPGTVTVQINNKTLSEYSAIPYLNFTQLSYVSQMSSNPNGGIGLLDPDLALYIYDGPSQAVNKVVSAVVGQGSISPIESSPINASWATDYSAPYLECSTMNADRSLRVRQNIANFTFAYNRYDCYTPYAYLSWYDDLPFVEQDENGTALSTATLLSSTDNLTISFAIMPAMLSYTDIYVQPGLNPPICYRLPRVHGNSSSNPLGSMGVNSTFIQCQLYNSSYHSNFQYSGGIQKIDTNIVESSLKTPIMPVENVQANSYSFSENASDNGPCFIRAEEGEGSTPLSMTNCSIFDLSVLQSLSYQAVMDAFGSHFAGVISPMHDYSVVQNSSVLSTALSEAAELAFLTDTVIDYGGEGSLQLNFLQMFGANSSGIPSRPEAASKQNFSAIMQELFKNVTVSLMSSEDLAPKVPDELRLRANVSTVTSQQVYVYSAGRLWLAYGLGIFFTSFAVLVGLLSIWTNEASYSDSFSSVLRVARRIELSAEITDEDTGGQDPLPKHLAKAKVVFSGGVKKSAKVNASTPVYRPIVEDSDHD